jgi:hypothetical protein
VTAQVVITDPEAVWLMWRDHPDMSRTSSSDDPDRCKSVSPLGGMSRCRLLSAHIGFHIGRTKPANDPSRLLGSLVYDVVWGVG